MTKLDQKRKCHDKKVVRIFVI